MSQYKILIFAANAKKRHKMPLPFIDFAPLIQSRYSKPPFELLSYVHDTRPHTPLGLAPLSCKTLKSFLKPSLTFYHHPVKTKKALLMVPLYTQRAWSFSYRFREFYTSTTIVIYVDAALNTATSIS